MSVPVIKLNGKVNILVVSLIFLEFERSVVPWTSDSESPLCRCCAAKFGLTRRRHHCRLCGRVMCHNCSRHLSFVSARKNGFLLYLALYLGKLTSPAIVVQLEQDGDEEERLATSPSHGQKLLEVTQKTTERMKMLFESTVSRMSGDGTEVSLGSLLQQVLPLLFCAYGLTCPPFSHFRSHTIVFLGRRGKSPCLSLMHTAFDEERADDGTICRPRDRRTVRHFG